MKVAILGFGSEGQTAYEYWREGNEITICDLNEQAALPDGVASQLGEGYLQDLDQFDLIVRSPGLHPKEIVDANSPDISVKVTSVTNEFFRISPTKNIIGVTGTKGKGTTSTLIYRMLQAAGKRVFIGGNIGLPALELLKEDLKPTDWVVLELSSFQLCDIKYSPHIAVCLMVVPEHLNWHADMAEYLTAKQQLFRWQQAGDIAIYNGENPNATLIAKAGSGEKLPFMQYPGAEVNGGDIEINRTDVAQLRDIRLLGAHNQQNVCAAITAFWQVSQDTGAIKNTLTSFTGLEHRLELVREVGKVRYYDDSFGTTPETAIVAIEALSQPKVLILGGSDKGSVYDELVQTVLRNQVRAVVAIGDTGPKIANALRSAGFTAIVEGGKTMPDIVAACASLAQPGDAVLLSTGSASFGLFKDYKDRGNQFKDAVKKL